MKFITRHEIEKLTCGPGRDPIAVEFEAVQETFVRSVNP